MYGDLGLLHGEDSIGFGDWLASIRAQDHIRLIGNRAQSERIEDITKLIDQAARLVFLGFGFDSMNLDALGLGPKLNRYIFASAKGLSAVQKANAQSRIGKINWGDPDETVVRFLHNSLAFR